MAPMQSPLLKSHEISLGTGSPPESPSHSSPARSPKGRVFSPQGSPTSLADNPSRVQKLVENLTKPGTAQELRSNIAYVHREMLKELRPISAGGSYTSISALTHLLEHRFGSITAAWRSILDPNMKGKASFSDFCIACRDVGFCRKMKPLWKQMTGTRPESEQGYIELEHLDADAAAAVKEFRSLNRERHGSMAKAWKWFDARKKTRVDLTDFRKRCAELGFVGHDVDKTFHWLKLDPSRPYLVCQDFDERALQCCYREDLKNKTWKSATMISASRSEGSLWSPQSTLLPYERETPSPMSKASSTGDLRPGTSDSVGSTVRPGTSDSFGSTTLNGTKLSSISSASSGLYKTQKLNREREAQARTLDELKQLLRTQYGSQYDAWRHALDVNGDGQLSFPVFCDAIRSIGFQGNLKDVWQALVPDRRGTSGFVSLKLLDPSTSSRIESYKAMAKKKFGCLLQSWGDLDNKGSGMVDETQFVRHCSALGWAGSADAKKLFQLLKHEKEHKFLTLKEYDVKAYSSYNRGHTEMLTQHTLDRTVNCMDFQQRQDATLSQRWAKMAVQLDREDTEKHHELTAPHIGPQDVKALKNMLIRKYGTLAAGWKHGIDLHGSGRVAFGEMCVALRRLGFCGKFRDVFIELKQATAGEGTTLEETSKNALERQKTSNVSGRLTSGETVNREQEAYFQEVVQPLLETRRRTAVFAHDAGLELKAAEKDADLADGIARGIRLQTTQWTDAVEKQMAKLRLSGMEESGGTAALKMVLSLGEKSGADPTLLQGFPAACQKKVADRTDIDDIMFSRMEKALVDQLSTFTTHLSIAEADQASKAAVLEDAKLKAEQTKLRADEAAKEVEEAKGMMVKMSADEKTAQLSNTAATRLLEVAMSGKTLELSPEQPEQDRTMEWGQSTWGQSTMTMQDKATPKGILTLANFDSEAFAMLKEFRDLLIENYGTYLKAWQVLDINRNNAVEEEQFIEACGKIGFSKDPKLLFKNLLDGPSKKEIRISDLDPVSFKEYQRGGIDIFQPLEKAKAKDWTKEWLHMTSAGVDGANGLYRRSVEKMEGGGIRVFSTKTHNVLYFPQSTAYGPGWYIQQTEGHLFIYQARVVYDPADIASATPPSLGWSIYEGDCELPGKKAPVPKVSFPQANEWLQVEGAGVHEVNDYYRRDALKLDDGGVRVFAAKSYSLVYYPKAASSHGQWYFQKGDSRPYAVQVENDPIDVICATPPISGWTTHEANLASYREERLPRFLFPQASSVHHKAEQAKRMTASDWKTFKAHLIRKYGTIIGAWRNGLDFSANGKLSFAEFSKACRHMGFAGDVRKMFTELDVDCSGIITFNEIDPRWYMLVADFHSKLLAKHQTYQSAWRALDISGRNGIDEADFVKVCKELGYVGDARDRTLAARELFQQLKNHPGQLTLSLPDIEAKGCVIHGVASATPCAKHKARSAQDKRQAAPTDWTSMKEQLIRKYGTLADAWRDGLDTNGNGQLSFIQFSKACQQMGFAGDARRVFNELDIAGIGVITLNEVENCGVSEEGISSPKQADTGDQLPNNGRVNDQSPPHVKPFKRRDSMMLRPDEKAKGILEEMDMRRKVAKDKQMAPNSLESFKKLLIQRYGTITAAWRHGLDFSGNGKVSFIEFSKACRDVGFAGNIKAVFKEINKERKGIITFDQLDHGWYTKLSLFRDLLLKRFTKLDHRCMQHIDKNGNNTIELCDLVKTCEEIGYNLNVEELFEQLKRDRHRKFITMDDINAKGVITSAVDKYPDEMSLSPSNSHSPLSPSNSIRSNSPKRSQFERSCELSQQAATKLHPTRYFCSNC